MHEWKVITAIYTHKIAPHINVMLSLSYKTHHNNRYTLTEGVKDLIASG